VGAKTERARFLGRAPQVHIFVENKALPRFDAGRLRESSHAERKLHLSFIFLRDFLRPHSLKAIISQLTTPRNGERGERAQQKKSNPLSAIEIPSIKPHLLRPSSLRYTPKSR